jgi:hypothetical protein
MSTANACVLRKPEATPSPGIYRRRRPERTVLYQAVQENIETYFSQARWEAPLGKAVPAYVEHDLRQYLTCGILAHGFARAFCDECGHDFLIAFSCKGRGVCPSCNTRRMAQTAAHLVDHVIPRVPVRQWVLSLPKRLRGYLEHDPKMITAVLRIVLDVIEQALRQLSGCDHIKARFGAISYLHRFGSSLNPHVHFHCCVTDGLFSAEAEGVKFHGIEAITEEDLQGIQQTLRRRLIGLFKRRGLLEPDQAQDLLSWRHGGGFSLDASVQVEADDRAGLERLLRYCARPIFSMERLAWVAEDHNRLVYHLPKPMPDGRSELYLTPLELLDRLAQLTPPPRLHRHRYHGVFAPNAPQRGQVTALVKDSDGAPDTLSAVPVINEPPETRHPQPAYLWAILMARIYEVFPPY